MHVTNTLSLRNDLAGVLPATIVNEDYKFTEQLVEVLINQNTARPLIGELVSNDIRDAIFADTEWNNLTVGANWTEQINCAAIKEGTMVELRGRVQGSATAVLEVLQGIPASLRPTVNRTMAVDILDVSAAKILARGHVTVTTSGNVEFDFADYSAEGIVSNDVLFFDGCKYAI